jgi:hypothetical protein
MGVFRIEKCDDQRALRQTSSNLQKVVFFASKGNKDVGYWDHVIPKPVWDVTLW